MCKQEVTICEWHDGERWCSTLCIMHARTGWVPFTDLHYRSLCLCVCEHVPGAREEKLGYEVGDWMRHAGQESFTSSNIAPAEMWSDSICHLHKQTHASTLKPHNTRTQLLLLYAKIFFLAFFFLPVSKMLRGFLWRSIFHLLKKHAVSKLGFHFFFS